MAEERNYYIKLHGLQVPVEKEVYEIFRKGDRHLRTLQEKDERNGVVSYDALDSEEMLGEDMIPDQTSPSVEEIIATKILQEQLHCCLAQLSEKEQKLLKAIFFEGMTERECAQRIGISQVAVHKRRNKALENLRKLMEI